MNRTVLSSKKHKNIIANTKISKFDYTRIVKKGINNEHNIENVQTAEYPPLGASKSMNGDSISTTPSPLITHKLMSSNLIKRQNKTPPARPQKTRTKPPMSIHRKHGLIHPQSSIQSKSEKLRSKSEDSTPPKMALNEKKSVNFDEFVDIVDDNNVIHIESKKKLKQRSKSQTNKKSQKRSHRAVAKILLDELMSSNRTKSINKYTGFRLSDLLKDGMLSSDELMIEREQSDYYNYYYFLQSDKQIYQQFHKQFFNQFGNARKLQKMQKTNA